MRIIKAVYNFLVGDMVILLGVAVTVIILALLNFIPAFADIKVATGGILPVAVLVILLATLKRETDQRG
jgi:hypothetical protein